MSQNCVNLYTISFTVEKESGIALVAAYDERNAFQILKNGGSRNGGEYVLVQIRNLGMTANCSYGLLMESFVNARVAYDAIMMAANALVGPKGDTGAQGVQGEKGEPGNDAKFRSITATVDNRSGFPSVDVYSGGLDYLRDVRFDFHGLVGRQGERGVRGERGDTGKDGKDGLTSYEVAVNNGFYGSEAEWISVLMSKNSYNICWDGESEPDESLIPYGVTVSYDGSDYVGSLVASDDTLGDFYMVSDGNGEYDRYFTSYDGTDYTWVHLGSTGVDLSDYVRKDSEVWLTREEFDALEVKSPGVTYNIYEEEESEEESE